MHDRLARVPKALRAGKPHYTETGEVKANAPRVRASRERYPLAASERLPGQPVRRRRRE